MKIKFPHELQPKETLAVLIYGQSGSGKTTLACSAPDPVLLDFDGGVTRMRYQDMVPTLPVESYGDIKDALNEIAQSEFKTVVVDTVSKMIDCIVVHVCGNSQPTLKQWAQVNGEFKSFLRSVADMRKNVVFVAQREVERDGESTRYVPQVRASNYKDIICDLDLCGYLEYVTVQGRNCRQVTFDPSPRNEGKNTVGLQPDYLVPTLDESAANTFLAQIVGAYKSKQDALLQHGREMQEVIDAKTDAYNEALAAVKTADELNTVVDDIKNEPKIGALLLKLRKMVSEKAAAIGVTFNSKSARYE